LVDLVVARTLRILAKAADSDLWTVWIDGYTETLAALERGDHRAALQRYRQIYVDYRTGLQTAMFKEG
ncbi:MAG TPA: GntR family transcriptional regulator, partial [Actinoplanes sp.]|nr:GntR family transcriptional regulator [Actinoplanes sp.]